MLVPTATTNAKVARKGFARMQHLMKLGGARLRGVSRRRFGSHGVSGGGVLRAAGAAKKDPLVDATIGVVDDAVLRRAYAAVRTSGHLARGALRVRCACRRTRRFLARCCSAGRRATSLWMERLLGAAL